SAARGRRRSVCQLGPNFEATANRQQRARAQILTPTDVREVVVIVVKIQYWHIALEDWEHEVARAVVDMPVAGGVRRAIRNETEFVDYLVRHDENEAAVASELGLGEVGVTETLLCEEGDRVAVWLTMSQAACLGSGQGPVVVDGVHLVSAIKPGTCKIVH